MAKKDVMIQSQQASLQTLEVDVGQLAAELRNRPLGKLLADTKMPKREENEQCQAIELNSKKYPVGEIKKICNSHPLETANIQ